MEISSPHLHLKPAAGILRSLSRTCGETSIGLEAIWRKDRARARLDTNTAQTPGMTRAAAITHAVTGATKLWAGTVVVQPHAKTGPHHHGQLETVIYVVRGRARMR